MNIAEAAERSNLPAKTIRYYEDIALVRPARQANGYRDYSETDIRKLTFLSRARGLGFPLEECRTLLSLWEDRDRSSADVKALASAHLATIDRKLKELTELRRTLHELVEACHGDQHPDCPILEGLAGAGDA